MTGVGPGSGGNGGNGGPGTAPPGHVRIGRAIAIIVVAIVAGVLLLNVASRPSTNGAASSTQSPVTTTTTKPHTTTTTTPTTTPHGQVTVLVANGTSVAGLAEHYTQVLTQQGWNGQTPVDVNGGADVPTSTVYYAQGQKGNAEAVADELGLKLSAVAPLTASVPVTGAAGMDVVVVVGADLAAAASTTTTA